MAFGVTFGFHANSPTPTIRPITTVRILNRKSFFFIYYYYLLLRGCRKTFEVFIYVLSLCFVWFFFFSSRFLFDEMECVRGGLLCEGEFFSHSIEKTKWLPKQQREQKKLKQGCYGAHHSNGWAKRFKLFFSYLLLKNNMFLDLLFDVLFFFFFCRDGHGVRKKKSTCLRFHQIWVGAGGGAIFVLLLFCRDGHGI